MPKFIRLSDRLTINLDLVVYAEGNIHQGSKLYFYGASTHVAELTAEETREFLDAVHLWCRDGDDGPEFPTAFDNRD